jgi:hypothetical protein
MKNRQPFELLQDIAHCLGMFSDPLRLFYCVCQEQLLAGGKEEKIKF